MTDAARVFVPGHVTGFFTTDRTDDPTASGSRGGGVALTDGVEVTVEPATEPVARLNGERVEPPAVAYVLDALDAPVLVEAETPLPIGAGFGVSGALALGTALGANAVLDRELSRNELVTIAHGADVRAGTGLGDVVAQDRGGVPLRLEPGGPHHNVIDEVPARSELEYLVLGERSTSEVLGEDTTELTKAGERAISRVVQEPTLPNLMHASRRFAREAELLTPDVRDVVQDVTEAGGSAAMAMLGETVFATGNGLSEAGYDATETAIDPCGARLLE